MYRYNIVFGVCRTMNVIFKPHCVLKQRGFCKSNNYEYVWFCKDIERVYLGEKVEDGHKNREAAKFKANKLIYEVSESKLLGENLASNMSNILSVLDKFKTYLVRK